jgi:serine beta-lactamase-like protein LACTB, mitochondrial
MLTLSQSVPKSPPYDSLVHAVRLVILIAVLTPVVVFADDGGGSELPSSLDHVVRAAMAEHRLPSLSVAVAVDGTIVYATAHGFSDLENSVAASASTVYPLGSVTKTVTAAAAMRLVEQEHLDLDLPVTGYCPAFRHEQPEITSRQLLAHLGGIRHYDYRRFDEDFLNTKRYRSIEEALSKFAGDPLVAEPGAKYHYSSWGYVLLGCVLEGAAASSYAAIIEKGVLQPAGMRQTTIDSSGKIVPHRASGYSSGDDGSWRPEVCFDASDRIPAGSLLGTPTDLVSFGIALLDGRVLRPESLKTMWSMQETTSGVATGTGLGWTISEEGDEVFHGGTTVGGTAYLYIRPRDKIVVAFATNLSLWTEGRHDLARRLADLVAAEIESLKRGRRNEELRTDRRRMDDETDHRCSGTDSRDHERRRGATAHPVPPAGFGV